MHNFTCTVCGVEGVAKSPRRKYCSEGCRDLSRGPDCCICGERMKRGGGVRDDGRAAHHSCRNAHPEVLMTHGSPSAYRRGCRCGACKAGSAERMRDYVAAVVERDGVSPSARLKRIQRGVPVESQVCGGCGEPMGKSLFIDGATPMHKSCRGRFYVSADLRRAVYERDQWSCHLCGEDTNPDAGPSSDWFPSLDHVTPRSMGGDESMENLRTAHRWCNSVRGDKLLEEFNLVS